jgi:hypothetical protein
MQAENRKTVDIRGYGLGPLNQILVVVCEDGLNPN